MALFVDAAALANLERHDPAARLDDRNFTDFCLAVEGVSHFVYVALRRRAAAAGVAARARAAGRGRQVRLLRCCCSGAERPSLRRRLFGDVAYADDLDADERERYRTANQQAGRYAAALERRFVAREQTAALLAELRRFYRMDLPDEAGAHRPARLITADAAGRRASASASASNDARGAASRRCGPTAGSRSRRRRP